MFLYITNITEYLTAWNFICIGYCLRSLGFRIRWLIHGIASKVFSCVFNTFLKLSSSSIYKIPSGQSCKINIFDQTNSGNENIHLNVGPKCEEGESVESDFAVGNVVIFHGLQLDESLAATLFALGPGQFKSLLPYSVLCPAHLWSLFPMSLSWNSTLNRFQIAATSPLVLTTPKASFSNDCWPRTHETAPRTCCPSWRRTATFWKQVWPRSSSIFSWFSKPKIFKKFHFTKFKKKIRNLWAAAFSTPCTTLRNRRRPVPRPPTAKIRLKSSVVIRMKSCWNWDWRNPGNSRTLSWARWLSKFLFQFWPVLKTLIELKFLTFLKTLLHLWIGQ